MIWICKIFAKLFILYKWYKQQQNVIFRHILILRFISIIIYCILITGNLNFIVHHTNLTSYKLLIALLQTKLHKKVTELTQTAQTILKELIKTSQEFLWIREIVSIYPQSIHSEFLKNGAMSGHENSFQVRHRFFFFI